MKIVTGYTGTPHISSNDNQAFNQGVFGNGNCVLNVGERFDATLSNATTVVISDGDGVMQGVHFRIEPGTTEIVTISTGTNGYNRIDLICAKYSKNANTRIEDVQLVVIEGTPSTGVPTEPTYIQGNILEGDVDAFMPIWKVTLTGLTPVLTRYKETQTYPPTVIDMIYPVGSIYMSVNATNPGNFFGGTWVEWGSGRVPVGVKSNDANFNTVEKIGGESTHTLTVEQMPGHAHNYQFTVVPEITGVNLGYGTEAVGGPGDYSQSMSTYTTGGGQAHNNLQPYITCYMWKRTA